MNLNEKQNCPYCRTIMDQNALEEYQKQESIRSKEKTTRHHEEGMQFIGI